jgi:hypothetical protein
MGDNRRDPADPGAPIKSLDQKMFWRDRQWVGRESIGAALGW